jgi:hypothetical protein
MSFVMVVKQIFEDRFEQVLLSSIFPPGRPDAVAVRVIGDEALEMPVRIKDE